MLDPATLSEEEHRATTMVRRRAPSARRAHSARTARPASFCADGRRGLARQETDSRDLVVGDAFGGVTVPWHLTTIEAVRQVDRVLSEDGVYVLNLIDYGPLDFARAEVATLRTAFEHVAVSADPTDLDTVADELDGGNLVAIASDAPIDAERVQRALDAEEGLGWQVIDGPDVDRWVGGADVLTDDHAPVDQLITQSPY